MGLLFTYITIWIVSYFIPSLVANYLHPMIFNSEIASKKLINTDPYVLITLCCIFATLNCIFFRLTRNDVK